MTRHTIVQQLGVALTALTALLSACAVSGPGLGDEDEDAQASGGDFNGSSSGQGGTTTTTTTECADNEVKCGGICLDVTANPFNCGGCGQQCLSGEICHNSQCVPDGEFRQDGQKISLPQHFENRPRRFTFKPKVEICDPD